MKLCTAYTLEVWTKITRESLWFLNHEVVVNDTVCIASINQEIGNLESQSKIISVLGLDIVSETDRLNNVGGRWPLCILTLRGHGYHSCKIET